MIEVLKEKVLGGYALSYDEAVELSKTENKNALYKAADEIREKLCGNKMDLCSITNAKSGKCPENCKWCSQSAHFQTDVEEYEIVDRESTVNEAVSNAAKGVKRHSLVTSGRKVNDKTLDKLIPIYKEIQEKSDIELCASMGLISEEQLKRLNNEIGLSHYHCNLETAPSYFDQVCTTHTIDEKIETIKAAKKLGIDICSGGIIGMGETMEHRIEMAVALRDLEVQSIPINVLMPIEGTPMENTQELTEEEILTTIAIFRFLNPTAKLRFAGGRLKIKAFQDKALHAGINAALTGDYLTTTGSDVDDDVRDFEKCGFKVR